MLNWFRKNLSLKSLPLVAFFALLFVSTILRLYIFDHEGGDHYIYTRAVEEFLVGVNPYIYTVSSFRVASLDHGYAYFPTLLYILTFLWQFNEFVPNELTLAAFWKIPTLLADLGVAVFLMRYFYNRNTWLGLFCATFWLFNPYFLLRYEYTLFDPIQVFFLFMATYLLGKKDYASGVFYGLALSIKLVPIILLPIFIYHSKDWRKVLLAIFGVFLFISLPFVTNIADIYFYVKGTLLVHAERTIQGRPILSFITYYLQDYGVNFYQVRFASFYSSLALFAGPLVTLYLLLKRDIRDKYILTAVCFALYFLFTPVFNRTHIIWGLPFFMLGTYEYLHVNKKYYIYPMLVSFYIVLSFYTFYWYKGLKPPIDGTNRVWIDSAESMNHELPIETTLRNKFYDYRHTIRELVRDL